MHDHFLPGCEIGIGKINPLLPGRYNGHTGSNEVTPPIIQHIEHLYPARSDHRQINTEIIGETRGKLILEPEGLFPVYVIGAQAVLGDHDDTAMFPDPVKP